MLFLILLVPAFQHADVLFSVERDAIVEAERQMCHVDPAPRHAAHSLSCKCVSYIKNAAEKLVQVWPVHGDLMHHSVNQ